MADKKLSNHFFTQKIFFSMDLVALMVCYLVGAELTDFSGLNLHIREFETYKNLQEISIVVSNPCKFSQEASDEPI